MKPALLLLLALAAPVSAARVDRNAPYCAPPGAKPLFISPMGEPFRGAAGQPWPSAAWFAGADLNHDGVVDRAEFIADAMRFFATLDHNHDGRLTPDEVIAYETRVAPEIALWSPRQRDPYPEREEELQTGDGGYGGAMGAGRYTWLNIPEPVASADMDVDRVVTAQEFTAAAGRRFDALDTARAGGLKLAALPHPLMQMQVEGPCRARPKRKRGDHEGPFDADHGGPR